MKYDYPLNGNYTLYKLADKNLRRFCESLVSRPKMNLTSVRYYNLVTQWRLIVITTVVLTLQGLSMVQICAIFGIQLLYLIYVCRGALKYDMFNSKEVKWFTIVWEV